jgi:D-3-phosphoglycerate dehydrogenase / 2-oxoglutarate reductase
MHIVIADSLPSSAVDLLRTVPGWTIDARAGRAPADLARDVATADAIIVRSATRVDADLMAAAPRLRVIARAGTGVDNVDVPAATDRGIIVMNAPGANSISVAELTLALMLSLSRAIPAADAAMKRGTWEKKKLSGVELRGKTLGLVGLGRIGQEVSIRARAFGMQLLAHDPFLSAQVAESLGVELLALDDLCARADYISLHVPATPETRHLFDARRFALCRPGVRIVNTARGELIDEEALRAAIESGHVGGAGLDVFQSEPPKDWRLPALPQVVATPHIAASTLEAQEQVGLETVSAVREYLLDGVIRSAVNFPVIVADDVKVQPLVRLAERMGVFLAHLAKGRTGTVSIRYYGARAEAHANLLASAAVAGVLRPMLSSAATIVNARQLAASRGIEIVESRSTRQRDFADMLSLKLHTTDGEYWVEGAVFEPGRPRLTQLDGVDVEAPLEGVQVVIQNEDRPGVIGDIGTILGRHGVNIASFALGRGARGAVGVVNVDTSVDEAELQAAVDELAARDAITGAAIVRFQPPPAVD